MLCPFCDAIKAAAKMQQLCFGSPRIRVTKIAPQHYEHHDRHRVCAAANKSQDF